MLYAMVPEIRATRWLVGARRPHPAHWHRSAAAQPSTEARAGEQPPFLGMYPPEQSGSQYFVSWLARAPSVTDQRIPLSTLILDG